MAPVRRADSDGAHNEASSEPCWHLSYVLSDSVNVSILFMQSIYRHFSLLIAETVGYKYRDLLQVSKKE